MCYEDDETWKADLSRWHTCGGISIPPQVWSLGEKTGEFVYFCQIV